MTSLRHKSQPHPLTQACDRTPRHFHNKACGWRVKKYIWVSGRIKKRKGESVMRRPSTLHSYCPSASSSALFLLIHFWPAQLQLFVSVLVFLPVVIRWIQWTVSAARRTSSLRRASRIWETSTTSVPAPGECQSTSAPFAGTAPQVTLEGEERGEEGRWGGGETQAESWTLPLWTNIITQMA